MMKREQVQGFVASRCEVSRGYVEATSVLYEAFVSHCEASGVEPAHRIAFGRFLTALGFGAIRSGRQRKRTGLRLRRDSGLAASAEAPPASISVSVFDASGAPAPPPHLSKFAAAWWSQTVQEWELDAAHVLMILTHAAEAWDLSQMARLALDEAGSLTCLSSSGNVVLRPEVRLGERARKDFARLVRELALDGEPAEPRIPRVGGGLQ